MFKLLTMVFYPFYWAVILSWYVVKGLKGVWDESLSRMGLALARQPETHGNADWATEKELKKRGHYEPRGWLFGIKDGKRLYTLAEASGIAMAPKGQGKTQTAIAQLLDIARRPMKDDCVVVDPAGDLGGATAQAFLEAGYDIKLIDFTNPRQSHSYDVFSILDVRDHYNFDRQVDQLVQLIMPDDVHSREAHFQEFARILFAGLIVHLITESPNDATLGNVVDILTTNVTRRNAVFALMRSSPNSIVRQAVSAFDEAGDKEKGSFSTTMARKLKVWLRAAVRDLTETGEVLANGDIDRGWTWEDIYAGAKPTIVYIVTGLGTGEGAAARLILGNAINARRYLWNTVRKKPPRDLRLVVDEAREIGNCHAIMDANNELRKAGVSVMMWFLSARDVFDIYPQAKTLINNSDLLVFGGSKEMDFMEDVSRLIGEKTIENKGYSESDHGESQSRNEQARRVIKADEIRRLEFTDVVAVMGNLAVKAKKPFTIDKGGVRYL